jgi:hypothetical protein
MAEAVPETGEVTDLITTPLGLHWLGKGGSALYRLGSDGNPVLVTMTAELGFTRLTASDTALVWLWNTSVWQLLLKAGAAPAKLATGVSLAGRPIFVDEAHVYYEPAFGAIGLTRIALAGGDPEKVPTAARGVVAVHDGYAYYKDSDSFGEFVMRTRVDGGAPEQVTKTIGFLDSPRIVFEGNVMYISTSSLVYRVEIGNPKSASGVYGLAPARDAGIDNGLWRMVLDGHRLVFADLNGTVGWASTDGTQCGNILVNPNQGAGIPGPPIDIALDHEYLYLLVFSGSSYHGSLYRVARSKVGL